jgi:hypothetical protein
VLFLVPLLLKQTLGLSPGQKCAASITLLFVAHRGFKLVQNAFATSPKSCPNVLASKLGSVADGAHGDLALKPKRRVEYERAGSQFEWAQREGIDRAMLNKVINGRKSITPSIEEALKVRVPSTYEMRRRNRANRHAIRG